MSLMRTGSRIAAASLVTILSGAAPTQATAQTARTAQISKAARTAQSARNVILVTLDGFRWQELFTGADSVLLRNPRVQDDTTGKIARYWRGTAEERRAALMPFMWSTIAAKGQIYGNRNSGSFVNVTNTHRFSYPGYNELLSGYADPRVDSNDKTPNPNRTVLGALNMLSGFKGRVAAFGSWDVFPFILSDGGRGVPVNAGFDTATGPSLSEREKWLNHIARQTPSPWSTVRLDVFTHNYALEYLKRARPRVLYVAYGETDDFAHNRKYDFYLSAAERADMFIRELWEWAQSDPQYRNNTSIVITTDHGRGFADKWTDHGADVNGADGIWLAAIGPDTRPLSGNELRGQWYQKQIASTVARLVGVGFANAHGEDAPFERVVATKGTSAPENRDGVSSSLSSRTQPQLRSGTARDTDHLPVAVRRPHHSHR